MQCWPCTHPADCSARPFALVLEARSVHVFEHAREVASTNLGAVVASGPICVSARQALKLQRYSDQDLVSHLLSDITAKAKIVDRQAPQTGIRVKVLCVGHYVPLSQGQSGTETAEYQPFSW